MPTPNASRVGDDIEHSNALLGALTGLAIGLLVGAFVAATILTGGLAAAAVFSAIGAVCTFASGGFALGQLLGSLGGSPSGVIGEGARSVFIGAGLPPAARALDKLACGDPPGTAFGWGFVGAVLLGPVGALAGLAYGISSSEHAGAQIATGSETVFIESRNAARVEDETSCSGKIIEGAKTVGIGGPKAVLIPRDSWRPEVPKWLEDTMFWVDRVGAVFSLAGGLRTLFKEGLRNLSRADRIDLAFTAVSTTLLGAEELSARAYGRDSQVTKTIGWVRTGVELTGGTVTGVTNVRRMRNPTPDVPGTPPRVDPPGTPPRVDPPPAPPRVDAPPPPPRVDAPPAPPPRVDAPPAPPRVDAPAPPRVDAPAPSAPKPVPQGGQTIQERVAQGGNPPPYAEANPNAYYYDPVAGRYKRR